MNEFVIRATDDTVIARAVRGGQLEISGEAPVPLPEIARVRASVDGRGHVCIDVLLANGPVRMVHSEAVSCLDDYTSTRNELLFDTARVCGIARSLAIWLGVPFDDDI